MARQTTKSATVTARIAPKLEKKLESYARIYGQTKSKAVEGILEQYLDYNNWVIQEVRKGIESADRGELVPHEEVFRKIREKSAALRKALRTRAA